jgi:hypothetical protein
MLHIHCQHYIIINEESVTEYFTQIVSGIYHPEDVTIYPVIFIGFPDNQVGNYSSEDGYNYNEQAGF